MQGRGRAAKIDCHPVIDTLVLLHYRWLEKNPFRSIKSAIASWHIQAWPKENMPPAELDSLVVSPLTARADASLMLPDFEFVGSLATSGGAAQIAFSRVACSRGRASGRARHRAMESRI